MTRMEIIPANFLKIIGMKFQYMMAKKLFEAVQWQEHYVACFRGMLPWQNFKKLASWDG